MTALGWPSASLDPVARLRVLAAGLPGVVLQERVLDAPVDEVWSFIADLERSVPTFDRDVHRLEIRGTRPDGRLDVFARGSWWLPAALSHFDVTLEDGWCWMVTRPQTYVVGMGAVPTPDGRTRFGHLEGVVLAAPRWLQPVVRPILAASRIRHRRHVGHDLDGIERNVTR